MMKLEKGDRFIDPEDDWIEVLGRHTETGEDGYLCIFNKYKEELDISVRRLEKLKLNLYDISNMSDELDEDKSIYILFIPNERFYNWKNNGFKIDIMRAKVKNWKEVLTNGNT